MGHTHGKPTCEEACNFVKFHGCKCRERTSFRSLHEQGSYSCPRKNGICKCNYIRYPCCQCVSGTEGFTNTLSIPETCSCEHCLNKPGWYN